MSADGKRVASSTGFSISVWDSSTGKEMALIENEKDTKDIDRLMIDVDLLRFSSDASMIACVGYSSAILIWNVDTQEYVTRIPGPDSGFPADVTSIEFSPDNKLLAVCRGDSGHDVGLKVWDIATGKVQFEIKNAPTGNSDVGFSPDGKLLATIDGNLRTTIWDISRNEELRAFDGRDNPQQTFLSGHCAFLTRRQTAGRKP